MSINRQIYNFAAKAGSLEGWVYKRDFETSWLPQWIQNIVDMYNELPTDVRDEIQDLCNETLGRAMQSLVPVFGPDHELIEKLKGISKGTVPSSPDDFPEMKDRAAKATRS